MHDEEHLEHGEEEEEESDLDDNIDHSDDDEGEEGHSDEDEDEQLMPLVHHFGQRDQNGRGAQAQANQNRDILSQPTDADQLIAGGVGVHQPHVPQNMIWDIGL